MPITNQNTRFDLRHVPPNTAPPPPNSGPAVRRIPVRFEREWVTDVLPNVGRGFEVLDDEDLLAVSVRHGDGRRFAEAFRVTWSSLPSHDRDELLDRWRRPVESAIRVPPEVEIVPNWPGRDSGEIARALEGGRLLVFHAPAIDALSVAEVRVVVARVLAEALILARDEARDLSDEVTGIVASWGFDPATPGR